MDDERVDEADQAPLSDPPTDRPVTRDSQGEGPHDTGHIQDGTSAVASRFRDEAFRHGRGWSNPEPRVKL